MFEHFWLAFVPIFVAVDPFGGLPVFIALTERLERRERRKVLFEAIATALCIAVGFILLGRAVFNLLGIGVGDFMVAGGMILFILAIIDLATAGQREMMMNKEVGAVPIGTPLLAGPALLTTSLIMIGQYGNAVTLVAVFLNLAIAGATFYFGDYLMRLLGRAGARALSKVFALFLAAIAVMLVRRGLLDLLKGP